MHQGSFKYLPAILWVAFAALGCGGKPAPTSGTQPAAGSGEVAALPPGTPAAADVLKQLLKTYREAKSYSDNGQVVLRYRQSGELIENKWQTAVKFERPSRLFVKAYQATIGCDGKELRGLIEDEATGNVDGQILVGPAPKELQLKHLAADPLLYDILSSQLRRQPIQLELLLESQGLASAFGGDVACKLLDDAPAGGKLCRRIEVPSPGGNFVFWVDAENSVLRRLEYPAAALLPELVQDPSVQEVSLIAELDGAELNPTIPPERFVLAIPAGAKKMKSLVMPPQPLPSDQFGKPTGDFFFTQLDGEKLSSKDLRGKVAILTWFRNDPACPPVLAQVEQARIELAQNSKVAFYAVSTDPSQLGGDDLAKLLSSWSVSMPIVRDLEAFGDSLFKIQVQPTVIVLDENGRVQIVQAGGGPQLARQLGVILEKLAKGEDVAAEILKRAETEKTEYAKLLETGGPEPSELVEIPETVIRKQSEPRRIKLEEVWTCKEIKSPGNITVLSAAGQPDRLLVFSGWRTICEVSAAGKLQQTRELPIPPQAAVSYLRTAEDRAGKRHYLVSAPLAPAFFLFDDHWQLTLTYPADGSAPQLADAQLARLSDDDEPQIYAGYVDLEGLRAVTLDGKLAWRSRTFPNVLGVAVSPERDSPKSGAGILITGDAGTLLRVSGNGKEQKPHSVEKFAIVRVSGANFASPKQSHFLAIASNQQGNAVALGLNAALDQKWQYVLPLGGHQRPIEPVASGELLPRHAGTWVIAGPDGSVHFISEDGELTDSFHVGQCITGIAISKVDGVPVLLVATEDGVTAWRVK